MSKDFTEHHHSPQVSNAEVAKSIAQIKIKCVKRSKMFSQPQTLKEINIPDFLQFTFNGDRFLDFQDSSVTSKSVEIYRCLFEELFDFAIENSIDLQPSVILTDFEQASIIASCLFSLILHHLFALALLLSDEIPKAFNALKLEMPSEADKVVK
ncbi:hypothetical protein C1646_750982 [Rhizophagus diaphanus]|nr:hypothetical protein C1646_750982 [Rhizophagus diaphanus] [Rhizophagus sp. MUCL 43196]